MRNQAEAHLSALIESTQELVWSVDLDLRLMIFNGALQRQVQAAFGIDPTVGMRLHELLPPDQAALWPPYYERALRDGSLRIEYLSTLHRTLELVFNPIVVQGKTTGISVFGEDITRRKAAEESCRFLAAIVESFEDAVHAYALDGTILRTNRGAEEMFGYRREEIVGKNIAVLVLAGREQVVQQNLQTVGTGRAVAPFDTRVRRKDGVEIDVSIAVSPICNAAGEVIGASGIFRDISERKCIERAILDAERKYHTIFDGALEGIFQSAPDARPLVVNPALAAMLGYDSPKELLATVTNVAREVWAEASEHGRFMEELAGRGFVRGFECRFQRRDGSILWGALTARRVNDAAGELLYHEGFIIDITERKRMMTELAESEARFRMFFEENGSVMLLLTPSSGEIVAANRAAADFYGYPQEQLIGMRTSQLNTPAPEELAHDRQKALAGRCSFFTYRNRLASGEEREVEVYSSPFVVSGRTLLCAIVHDVSERKRTEEALRESGDFLAEVQSIGNLGCYVLDFHTGKWTSTRLLDQIFGIGEEYVRNFGGWVELVHPEERATVAAYFTDDVLGMGRDFDREYRILRPSDGEVRWVHGLGRVEFDAQGAHSKMRGTIRDITERKRAEMQLRDSEERYRATFEQAAVGIVYASFEGRYLRCNARFAEIVGYSQEEIAGLSFQQITAPEDLDAITESHRQILEGVSEYSSVDKRYIRKDGSLVWAKVTLSPQRDAEGRTLYFIAIVEDISERKAAEERLAASSEALRASEERYRTVFQTSLDCITISLLCNGKYVDVNNAFLHQLGYEREEIIGQTSAELGIWENPSDRQIMVDALRRYGSFVDINTRFIRKNGAVFWVQVSGSVIEINGDSCILSVFRDVSVAKAAEQRLAAAQQALQASEERYRTAFQTSQDAVAINYLDNGNYIDVNQAFIDITGFQRQELIGRSSLDLNIWADPHDREKLVESLRQNSACRELQAQFKRKNGEAFWGIMSASVMELDGVPCILSISRDITNAKVAEEAIRNLAFYDPLTGLPNRRLLLERLEQTLAASGRSRRERALLFVDLDDFKTLNDTQGHPIGDLLLQEAAQRLKGCIRESDTVARLGGDEFVVMIGGLSEVAEEAATQAKQVGEKILEAIRQPYQLDGRDCRSSASVGITIFGDRGDSIDEVLQQADIAMYQAKAAGRNTIRFFAPALQAAINARAALEKDLRRAIIEEQFLLYYQPQMDRGVLTGAEALVRWMHPLRSILNPVEFISLAEETGLILPLGDWVLVAACRQIAAWAAREETAHLTVSVNISARQFRQSDFVEQVLGAIECTGADPHRLQIELTESMLVEDVDEVIARMTELKSHGLRFSLDDFGTGYSSLSYLKRLPLDQLKIDLSFVRDILVDATSGAIAQTIISLSHAMGLSVLAEGVETEEQRELLARLGCTSYQGFLFSHPLPVEAFERLLADTNRNAATGNA